MVTAVLGENRRVAASTHDTIVSADSRAHVQVTRAPAILLAIVFFTKIS
jgi:hypothetical protein